MAKKQKQNPSKDWAVVRYSDNVCAAIHTSDVNKDDERIRVISEHKSLEEANKGLNAYCKKNSSLIKQL